MSEAIEMNDFDTQLERLKAAGLEIIQAGGWCPVQICANTADGNYLYFRARGDSWCMAIAPTEDEAIDGDNAPFYKEGCYGKTCGFEAGYMPFSEAVDIVLDALKNRHNP
jgi:hypothetical protein